MSLPFLQDPAAPWPLKFCKNSKCVVTNQLQKLGQKMAARFFPMHFQGAILFGVSVCLGGGWGGCNPTALDVKATPTTQRRARTSVQNLAFSFP